MKNRLPLLAVAALIISSCNTPAKNDNATAMTDSTTVNKSDSANWISLFDGKTTQGWHNYGKTTIGEAWKVSDGALFLDTSKAEGWQTGGGGDIVTENEYENFHLKLEWKIAKNGNSGIIFFIHEDTTKNKYVWNTGPEMQVLDNNGHPDAKIIKHRAGDLYDLISSSKETVKPAGEWNEAEIVVNNNQLNFFLNGTNIVSTSLWDDSWKKLIAGSKFKDMKEFGTYKKGKIALQDHGDMVWYRNIRIKEL